MIKIIAKPELILANKMASKAKARAIEPNFLESIRRDLLYIVNEALDFQERPNFVRCFVTIGHSLPTSPEELDILLLDIPQRIYDNLEVWDVSRGCLASK